MSDVWWVPLGIGAAGAGGLALVSHWLRVEADALAEAADRLRRAAASTFP